MISFQISRPRSVYSSSSGRVMFDLASLISQVGSGKSSLRRCSTSLIILLPPISRISPCFGSSKEAIVLLKWVRQEAKAKDKRRGIRKQMREKEISQCAERSECIVSWAYGVARLVRRDTAVVWVVREKEKKGRGASRSKFLYLAQRLRLTGSCRRGDEKRQLEQRLRKQRVCGRGDSCSQLLLLFRGIRQAVRSTL